MKKKQFKQNDNNYAIAYYRYSSHNQRDVSVEQQQEAAKKYAEAHDLKIVKEYVDRAMSGEDDDRPQFNLMLSEIDRIKPSVLILWKTDRLARDRYTLILSKKKIKDSGCSIQCVAEAIPTDSKEAILIEGIYDSMAEYYNVQLRENIMRGLKYNASNAIYNGHKLLGYKKGEDKHYIIDETTEPIVKRIFNEYANGKSMAEIARKLNEQGLKTSLNRNFTVNGLRSILKNRAYIGEYHFGDIIIANGMPAIISEELFYKVQDMFELNKRKGTVKNKNIDDAPRFWLTGKLYCGECGSTIHGMSGTSKTKGQKHYYYACKEHRKHKCDLKPVRKNYIESLVIAVLDEFLSDSENLTSLAVDISTYYRKLNKDESYLQSLKAQQKEVETALSNLIKALEKGIFSDSTQARLLELESQKKAIAETIEAEKIKLSLSQDEYSIKKYFEFYKNADIKDEQVRNTLLDYFIDKIYIYNDRLVITCFYSDDKYEIDFNEVAGATDGFSGSTASCTAPLKIALGAGGGGPKNSPPPPRPQGQSAPHPRPQGQFLSKP